MSACPALAIGICPGGSAASLNPADAVSSGVRARIHSIPARHVIVHSRQAADDVPIICSGWAASSVMLSDGRKQILSFLLPGDLASTAYMFGAMSGRTIEALTDVTYRTFRLGDLKDKIFTDPRLIERIVKFWFEERRQTDEIISDLGRRSAHEKLARTILGLSRGLFERGMSDGKTMEFPLLQKHLADATGLTPVHVCKVLGEFQRNGMLEIGAHELTFKDEHELKVAADAA